MPKSSNHGLFLFSWHKRGWSTINFHRDLCTVLIFSFRGFPSDTVGCMTIPHTECFDDGTYNAILVGNTSDYSISGFTENDG